MKKFYIVASFTKWSGLIAGIFCSDFYGHPLGESKRATSEQIAAVKQATEGYDCGSEDGPKIDDDCRAFNRKDARILAAAMNKLQGNPWNWRVIEVGAPAERDMRPVLGWRIECRPMIIDDAWKESVATQRGTLVDCRAKARRMAEKFQKASPMEYRVVPVYTAYQCDPIRINDDGSHVHRYTGTLRFRTKAAAEAFAKDNYHAKLNYTYEVFLLDTEVAEDQLYVPL